jgi:hypothetical protein
VEDHRGGDDLGAPHDDQPQRLFAEPVVPEVAQPRPVFQHVLRVPRGGELGAQVPAFAADMIAAKASAVREEFLAWEKVSRSTDHWPGGGRAWGAVRYQMLAS